MIMAEALLGATPIELLTPVRGDIDYDGDQDWFRFEAVEGAEYTIETDLITLDDSVLRLIDSDGRTEIDSNDDADTGGLFSRIEWTADSSGPKYVEVTAFENGQGIYEVKVEINLPENPVRMDVPSDRGGQISPGSDTDWFVFTADEGSIYVIETELVSLTDSTLSLRDSDEITTIAFDDDSGPENASRIIYQAATGWRQVYRNWGRTAILPESIACISPCPMTTMAIRRPSLRQHPFRRLSMATSMRLEMPTGSRPMSKKDRLIDSKRFWIRCPIRSFALLVMTDRKSRPMTTVAWSEPRELIGLPTERERSTWK